MTYLAEEGSIESGRPIEVYIFTVGTTIYRFTSAAEEVTVGGNLYSPVTISREAISLGTEDRSSAMVVNVSGDNPVAQLFTRNSPTNKIILEIIRVHFADLTDTRSIWKGEVAEVQWYKNTAEARIMCRPVEGAADAATPRYDSGIQCPYMLYDSFCTVAEASFKFTGTASSVSGNQLVVSGLDGGGRGVGWATAGKIRFGSDVRLILEHKATDTLILGSPFFMSPNGLSVDVFAGCDHTVATCNSKFANLVNFGGRPEVPVKDATRTGI